MVTVFVILPIGTGSQKSATSVGGWQGRELLSVPLLGTSFGTSG